MYSLDGYDEKILSELCSNSRTTYRELASSAKLSKDAVYQRVQQYKDEGIIDGFITRIAQSPFCDAVVNVMVKTSDITACMEFLASHPRVNWAARVLGDHDVAFTYFAQELEQARNEIKRDVDEAFVKSLSFNLYTNEQKFDRIGIFQASTPSNQEAPCNQEAVSELDRRILKRLAKNSRASYADIAYDNDVSGATVSRHVKRLRDNGIIQGFTVALRPYKFGFESYFVGVRDAVVSPEAMQAVVRKDAVTFFTETIGYYDYLCRVTVPDQDSLQSEMQDVQDCLNYPSLDIHHVLEEPKEAFVPPATI